MKILFQNQAIGKTGFSLIDKGKYSWDTKQKKSIH